MLTWELVGAVIGAGLASGREIASFFSRYGVWGYGGITIAVTVLIWLSSPPRMTCRQNKLFEKVRAALLSLLVMTTGGAMLSAAGELAMLMLPQHGAQQIGMILTFILACLLAYRSKSGLAWVSCILMIVLMAVLLCGLLQKPQQHGFIQEQDAVKAMLHGAVYGGFNAALQIPLLMAYKRDDTAVRKAIKRAGGLIGLLLMLGHTVLLKHPALIAESMPFIRLTGFLGKTGYYLYGSCLYLAVLSTLIACLRGIKAGGIPIVCIWTIALLGFSGVVDLVYPVLGAACMLLLILSKLPNC